MRSNNSYFDVVTVFKVSKLIMVLVTFLVLLMLLNGNKVSAGINNGPYHTTTPTDFMGQSGADYLMDECNSAGVHTGGMYSWLSLRDNRFATSVINVPYGTTSINMQINHLVLICDLGMSGGVVGGSRIGTNFGFVSTDPEVTNVSDNPAGVDWQIGSANRWHLNDSEFTYDFGGPLTADTTRTVTVTTKGINWRSYSPAFGCVGGGYPSSYSAFDECSASHTFSQTFTIDVADRPIEEPTCSVTNLAASFKAGLGANMTRVNVTNNDSIEAISIDSSSVTVGVSTSSGGTGSIANSSSRTFNQSSNTTVNTPGTHTATWSVDWSSGTQSGTITCSSNVSITVEPVSCTSIGPSPIDTSVPFRPTLTISNPNYIAIPVTGTWTINGATPASGSGSGTIPAGPSSSGTIPSSITTSVPGSGTYQITWTVSTAYAGSNPTDMADCEGVTTALDKPYTRFYGNDVITDGGIGASCPDGIKLPDGAPVVSNGLYNSSTQSHATYQGSASELAIFATGQITGVLPGSQLTSRSPLWELSIANDPILSKSKNPGNYEFGGGYGAEQCVAEFPDTTGFSPPGSGAVPATSGNTAFTGDIEITGGNFGIIQRSTFVIEGNVTISDNITYDTLTPWNDIDEIPLFRLYVSGNIYIDGNVDRLDGLYVAGQTIYTCTNGSSLYSTDKEIVDNCNRKLTVNGAFTSDKVELQRIIGTIGSSNPGESSNEPHIAESFVFSPELYLALLSESKNNFHGTNFDSIISLPPAF